MENLYDYRSRKPNLNTWVCPLDSEEMNSRGAAGHLRNKHSISWKKEYLKNPKLIRKRKEWFTGTRPYLKVKEIFSDIEYKEDDDTIETIDNYFWFGAAIRGVLIKNDKVGLKNINFILSKFLKKSESSNLG